MLRLNGILLRVVQSIMVEAIDLENGGRDSWADIISAAAVNNVSAFKGGVKGVLRSLTKTSRLCVLTCGVTGLKTRTFDRDKLPDIALRAGVKGTL